MRIGLLHPGEMGTSIGAALVQRGHEVAWVSAGRGETTRRRAEQAGLVEQSALASLVQASEVIFSVCPPHAASEVAESIGAFSGCFVDANAISPARSREIGALIQARGGRFVDGGIIGGPDAPRLYLAGEEADEIAALFDQTAVSALVLKGEAGMASALKVAYAAWTKASAAMLLSVRAYARVEHVEGELLEAWSGGQGGLLGQSLRAGQSAMNKGWRWVGEMEEIAASFASVGLPSGFHDAAAEVFARSPRAEDAPADEETLEAVLGELAP